MDSPGTRTRPEAHVLTVDVEEYFQVAAFSGVVSRSDWDYLPSRVGRSIDVLLGVLEKHEARGTFFTLGWIADRHPAVVRKIAAAGHEIASHGWSHRGIAELGPDRFREEARRSRMRLEGIAAAPVLGFRAPNFSLVPGVEWAFDILLEEGYRYDSSLFPARRFRSGYPGAERDPHLIHRDGGTLLELPLATISLGGLRLPAAGGAYLRHLPYGFVRRALRECAERRACGVFYVHPWELDPHQPRLPGSPLARLRHYRNLERTLPKLKRLLSEFRFTSVSERFRLPDGTFAAVAGRGPA